MGRLGAGIHLGPNLMRVFDKIGIAKTLIENGVQPEAWVSVMWDTGAPLLTFPLKGFSEKTYGAPYLTVHRGDLQEYLVNVLHPGTVQYGKKLAQVEETSNNIKLSFEDGSEATAKILIGADGVYSKVRAYMFGIDPPRYTGVIGHRALFPTSLLGDIEVGDYTRWWKPDRNLIVYFLNKDRKEVYVVTGAPQAEWSHSTSSAPCTKEEFRAAFAGFTHEALRVVDATPPEVLSKWAFFDREALPTWHKGRAVLLGDACHPMKPHMGQGAAMAVEDAAMLLRCLNEVGVNKYREVFELYEANRHERATKVQITSRSIAWLSDGKDPFWLYGYDVFSAPLVAAK
jgi:6-hydroxynicotinate 3-monooxygenase